MSRTGRGYGYGALTGSFVMDSLKSYQKSMKKQAMTEDDVEDHVSGTMLGAPEIELTSSSCA